MRHAEFLIWMICYPISVDVITIINYKIGRLQEFDRGSQGVAAIIHVVIWLFVGFLLFVF